MNALAVALVLCILPAIALAQPSTPPPVPVPTASPTTAVDPGYHLAPGPYKVTTVELLTLTDESRAKELRVKVRVPVVKGEEPQSTRPNATPSGGPNSKSSAMPDTTTFPLILFSHGLGGSKDAFGELCDHLASHGYVVISPSHADSIAERTREGERVTRDNAFDIRQMTPKAKWGRVSDMTFILDSLDVIESRVGTLRKPDGTGRIDRDRIAAAGHSAGALTTQLLGGMKSRDPENTGGGAKADPRIKAAVVISGQGVNGLGIRETAWDEVAIPWLVITGSLDTVSISKETPQTRRHPFEKARGKEKGGPPAYLLWIEGATHASYQGKSGSRVRGENPTTDIQTIYDCTRSATLAFLDAHVKKDAKAEKYLTNEKFQSLTDGAATLEAK